MSAKKAKPEAKKSQKSRMILLVIEPGPSPEMQRALVGAMQDLTRVLEETHQKKSK